MNNAPWASWLDKAVDRVGKSLGIKDGRKSMRSELCKLLLYREGAMFKPPKDTEKTPGMFGTLVVCLPSMHEGGDLRLSHRGKDYHFSTSAKSEFGQSFAT